MSRAGVLLDRDGTLIVDSGYVGSVSDVHFLPGALEAVAALNAAGIPVAVVTNQAGVARGYFDLAAVEAVHAHIDSALAEVGGHVDQWLYCPYHPDGVVPAFTRASSDRKPAPGMALAAAAALDLDLHASWVVGDADTDVLLAHAVGARPIRVGAPDARPHVVSVPDLACAVEVILAANDVVTLPRRPEFPLARYESADAFGRDYAEQLARALDTVDLSELDRAAKVINTAHDDGHALFACGNGGSASIANHLQCDHVKGVRVGTGLLARVQSLSTNVELFSAIANDIGYDAVFEYQLESQARAGDVLIAISSSGRSPNIVRALEWAGANGLSTIALTGFDGEPARSLATVTIHVDTRNYGIIEDAHQACMHLLAQYVRQSRMSDAEVAAHVF
jgi:D-sedoheptulose 7-phosphate isomerase/D-glycero-D-manno-heptose 1,7-bisphosphate phosphatase